MIVAVPSVRAAAPPYCDWGGGNGLGVEKEGRGGAQLGELGRRTHVHVYGTVNRVTRNTGVRRGRCGGTLSEDAPKASESTRLGRRLQEGSIGAVRCSLRAEPAC
jgi:hypothetical protein